MKQVYLAGDMYGNWTERIAYELNGRGYKFCKPKDLYAELSREESAKFYKEFDLIHVDTSDLVICYVSKDNPSGFGACCECGRASGKNIPVLTCLELTGDEKWDNNRSFISAVSSYYTNDFEELVKVVKRLAW